MPRRLQVKIATSRYALPLMAVYTAVVLLLFLPFVQTTFIRIGILAVSACLMAILNNINALIRIYSRMVSCSFLALTTMTAFAHDISISDYFVQLCCIIAILLLFSTYQDKKAQGTVFYAFLCISIASTQFIQILFFVPFIWLIMATNMMAITVRMFFASLLGLITPYWFLAGYCAYIGDISILEEHFTGIIVFGKPLWLCDTDTHYIVSFSYIVILSLTGIIHYLRNSYGDKIRTRMMYEALIILNALTILFIILQPQHINELTGILTISASTLIAHFIALTNTKLTNIFVSFIIIATFLITAYNIWIP